jgi:peptidyl-prolyl cis-trans isomerase C
LARIPESDRGEFLTSRQRIAGLLENMLMNRVLAEEAFTLKIDQDPQVKAEIRNQTERVLAKYRRVQFSKGLPQIDHAASAREAYLTDPAKSERPAAYKAWHILVRPTPTRDKNSAKKRAEEALQRVKKGYDDLDQIALEFSDDPSAKTNKGVLDMARGDQFEPSFAAAVTKLKPGEVSPVVETRFGFHVIYLVELLPSEKLPFEALKTQLMEESRAKYESTKFETHLREIREDKSIKLNEDALEKIRPKIPENFKPDQQAPTTIKAPPRKKTPSS